MTSEEKTTLIQAIELREHIAKQNKQPFVDLTYTMAERIIKALKESQKD